MTGSYRIAGERKQTGVLTLPTEAADTSFARRLEDGYADNHSADLAVTLLALPHGYVPHPARARESRRRERQRWGRWLAGSPESVP